jgi:S-ribosylhomocysteine lyase LuxS involved in autoinducer biosynthesis
MQGNCEQHLPSYTETICSNFTHVRIRVIIDTMKRKGVDWSDVGLATFLYMVLSGSMNESK